MNRIECIAYFAKDSKYLCDIGCDHAYALVKAIKEYDVLGGIAADIASGPIQNAKKTIEQYHLEDKIKTIVSDGFNSISKDSFDSAILSGMGGILITSILSNAIDKIRNKNLIIEANCDGWKVREFLFSNDFQIIKEEAIYDQGKYYEIMLAVPGKKKYDSYDITFGPILRRKLSQTFVKYYLDKINLFETILPKIINPSQKEEKREEIKEIRSILMGKNMEKYFINQTKNYYKTFFIDEKRRPTIFVSPGGGYQYTSPRESEPVVEAFQKRGYHVVVINYRETKEDQYPLPGIYLTTAIKEVCMDKRVGERIGLGFSAGGHCLLEACLHHEKYNFSSVLDLLILGYPVITSDALYAHQGSFQNLLKEKSSNVEFLEYLSLEKEVNKQNALDLFLWGTITDESVSVMNSLKLLEAYHAVGANAEYHMFPLGGHGLSVADSTSSDGNKEKEIPYISRWVDFACAWLDLKLKK
ncbi:MAG: tRNA (adenine(22)-N(1))-methyltransferase TrmK [Anaeroplasmataceae bacterium]|nr:tRNA (adenine(22)-N(1))-methyltransferase TrmK [Anaeroplasmataceae bacterium]